MSTRKRPLAELPPNIATTPTRYAPSTPHARRALQQRSGAKTRSARTQKTMKETVRPDSARGILRRLAKITAPVTRRITRTPAVASGKENEVPQDEDDRDEHMSKRPRMTFDIEESIEESMDEDAPQYEEEEDSELPAAPTPSVLPEEDDEEEEEPTNTFRSIDFARKAQVASERIDRRKSRLSMMQEEGAESGDDDDPTMLTERGRRAISEEATGRLSRYSFGSLRMSDFGTELEVRRDSDGQGKGRLSDARGILGNDVASDPGVILDDDTQYLRQSHRFSSAAPEEEVFVMPGLDDETFQLEIPEDEEDAALSHQNKAIAPFPEAASISDEEDVDVADDEEVAAELSPQDDRRLTELEHIGVTATTTRRRKRMKMTKHGTMVPSLPSSLIKHIATEVQVRNGRRRPKLGKDHMKALEQATEWFFEQAGEDLAAYAEHGRRKKRIDSSDVLMLMRRQRVLRSDGDLKRLAKGWLPKGVLKGLDLADQA